jgi:ABC-type Zn uptake system ZnuABC Zn-binding protein ZnuA
MPVAKKLPLLVLCGIVLSVVALFAACASRNSGDKSGQEEAPHEPIHAADTMEIPEIEAADLEIGERLSVVASTSIVGDVVANVGAGAIELTVLIGSGQDPHSYEPTPRALKAVEDAHLVFVNGLHLEEALLEAIEDTVSVPVAAVSAGITPLELGGEDEHGERHLRAADPHFWMDPNNVVVWVGNILHVLSEADPRNREIYEANAAAYKEKLEALDAGIRRRIQEIPENRRKLVTDHHVLGYFAEEYGFEVIGAILPSLSTSAEASAGEMAQLIELLRREGVAAVFIGSTAGQGLQSLADAVAEELGEEVSILPILTGSLASSGELGDTYLEYVEYNVDQIVSGLSVAGGGSR